MQPKESKSNNHFTYSIVKSIFRIVAGVCLLLGELEAGGITIIIAEAFGIKEEL